MRNLLSLILGLLSFISLFFLIGTGLFFLNSLNIWGPLLFLIFMIGCYMISAIPAIGTISACRSKKWVILALYIFQAICSVIWVVSILSSEGFALFYLIPFGSIGVYAVCSSLKCLSNEDTYDSRLKFLQQEASYYGWSATEYLHNKEELDKTYSSVSMVGFLILIVSIVLSLLLLAILL